jgi:hypothetical protein
MLRDDQFVTVNSKKEVHMKAVNWWACAGAEWQ